MFTYLLALHAAVVVLAIDRPADLSIQTLITRGQPLSPRVCAARPGDLTVGQQWSQSQPRAFAPFACFTVKTC